MADREERGQRTYGDVLHTIRTLARHFQTDEVIVVGSQAILLADRNAAGTLTFSLEVDAYPGNAKQWEAARRAAGVSSAEASEEINGHFGEGSRFHKEFGFYIDGVDENTATFPPGWRGRALSTSVLVDGRIITAISPSSADLIASKLWAGRDKDKEFIRAADEDADLDFDLLGRLVNSIADSLPEASRKKSAALAFLDELARTRPEKEAELPVSRLSRPDDGPFITRAVMTLRDQLAADLPAAKAEVERRMHEIIAAVSGTDVTKDGLAELQHVQQAFGTLNSPAATLDLLDTLQAAGVAALTVPRDAPEGALQRVSGILRAATLAAQSLSGSRDDEPGS